MTENTEQKSKAVLFRGLKSDLAFMDIEQFALRRIKEEKDKVFKITGVEEKQSRDAQLQLACDYEQFWKEIELFMTNTIAQDSKPKVKKNKFKMRNENVV